ncbi:DNA polymerase III subunit gamma/tau [Phragmitibacter flavus]|uniref:DNA polymerase III subunit gamma/tau n=1 Tax=Phragmitibacter flavus TaxID=2576071 RepID=A0A5R8KCH6_9BACT|nr:DNA polymerase III subunit gamma/tau [Phragmitibacter flavus]TLD70008.1 DNA polymerase III subunit gamma/tau [Phragmitibacter flavus]
MSYQVFARKYRPRTFDDVLGQEHVVRTLRNAIAQKRLAHAYLFVGPRGTGKTSTARIFAKALNCPGGPMVDFDPDNELCVEIEKGICLDVREIDGASNNGVEQVRELREEVKFAPTRCRFKIYYIDEVHMLSTAAFNALLKTLEEPPEHVKFIFATTEAHKVLPTIISRCQRFDLRRIPAGVIANHLLHIATLENVALDQKAAYAIAKGAEGGMRDAQSMLDQLVAFCGERIEEQDVLDIFGFTRGETVAHLAQEILQQDTVGALKHLHTQADGGKDLSRLLADLIQHFRNLLVHQVDAGAAEEDLSPEMTALVRGQSAMVEAESVLRVMDGLAEVDARMRWASNKLLHLEIGIIQAVQTLGEVTLTEVIQAIGGGGSGGAPRTITRRAIAPVAAVPVPVVATVPTPVAPIPVPASEAVKVQPEPQTEPAPQPKLQPLVAPPEPPAKLPEPGADLSFDLDIEPAAIPAKAEPLSLEALWTLFLERVTVERPLFANWVEFGAFLRQEGKVLVLGLPTTEDSARDNLMRPMARKFLEEMLADLTGKPVNLDIVLDATLAPPPVSEMSLGLLEMDSPSPQKAGGKEPEAAPKEETPKIGTDPDFYKDPLVKAAIEKFKATLVK